MRIWEIHRDLSLAIGDGITPKTINGVTVIPDGQRFKRPLRASYLYRAALAIYGRVYKQLIGQPREVYVAILERYFPHVIKTYEHRLEANNLSLIHI